MSSTIPELNIVPLPRLTTQDPCQLHPSIPQGSCLIIGPSGSGKTTVLVNMLLRREFGVLVHYHRIYVFSPTVFIDSSWELLERYRPFTVKCLDKKKRQTADISLDDDLTMEKLEGIMKQQNETNNRDRQRVLLLVDDFAADISNTRTLQRLAFRGRHMKVWLWLSSQLYRKVPRSLRVNVPYYIFFSANSNEIRTISEELATGSIAEFEDMYARCMSVPYRFLCVDMKLRPPDRYMFSFKKISSN